MHPMQKLLCYSVAALGCFASLGFGSDQQKKKEIDSATASANAEKLVKDIPWIESQPTLTKEATANGKLIFYMHMLGNLAGNT